MPTSVPMPTKSAGDIFALALWNNNLRDNINKLLNTGHRTLTVAQFTALTGPEGTKGVVAGDEVYLEVDATNGVLWHLVYESGETTYKWRFIGGSPLSIEVLATEGTASTSYTDLTTVGPAIPLPRAGDYEITVAAQQAGTGGSQFMAYSGGGITASDNDGTWTGTGTAGSAARTRIKQGVTTATITAKYRVSASTMNFLMRSMSIRPVRIRHDA